MDYKESSIVLGGLGVFLTNFRRKRETGDDVNDCSRRGYRENFIKNTFKKYKMSLTNIVYTSHICYYSLRVPGWSIEFFVLYYGGNFGTPTGGYGRGEGSIDGRM